MNAIANIFRSSLGKKFVMALTGMVLFGFVIMHMLGNLQIFLGPEQINAYAHFLKSTPEILWPARIGLLVTIVLHIWSAFMVSAENKKARPVGYAGAPAPVAATFASRTMLLSGLIVMAFIVYHLLHFTLQVRGINLTGLDFRGLLDSKGRHDVYRMMVIGYSNPWVSAFYVGGLALLCLHLSHGVSAMFQSLGLKNRSYSLAVDRIAAVFSWAIFLANASIPIAVMAGIIN